MGRYAINIVIFPDDTIKRGLCNCYVAYWMRESSVSASRRPSTVAITMELMLNKAPAGRYG